MDTIPNVPMKEEFFSTKAINSRLKRLANAKSKEI
jgi:hypothetical protein